MAVSIKTIIHNTGSRRSTTVIDASGCCNLTGCSPHQLVFIDPDGFEWSMSLAKLWEFFENNEHNDSLVGQARIGRSRRPQFATRVPE